MGTLGQLLLIVVLCPTAYGRCDWTDYGDCYNPVNTKYVSDHAKGVDLCGTTRKFLGDWNECIRINLDTCVASDDVAVEAYQGLKDGANSALQACETVSGQCKISNIVGCIASAYEARQPAAHSDPFCRSFQPFASAFYFCLSKYRDCFPDTLVEIVNSAHEQYEGCFVMKPGTNGVMKPGTNGGINLLLAVMLCLLMNTN